MEPTTEAVALSRTVNKAAGEQTLAEEIANSITHGIGAALSVAGLTLLLVYASFAGDPYVIVSVAVFGVAMVLVYLASTLYHSFHQFQEIRPALRVVDHCAIYLLIAGTYTPFSLVVLRDGPGWGIFGVVWGLALAGCIFKILFAGKWDRLSTFCYVAMGWLVLFVIKPVVETLPAAGLLLLLAGGVAYTAGVVFYLWDRLHYNHTIWHLFVMAGTALHFFAVFYFIVP